MKSCPFCAEEIQDAAIKCKHCGEKLAGDATKVVTSAQSQKVNPLAGFLSFLGLWALYYGGSKWFGANETQSAMTAGGAGDFSKPMMDQMMNSGLTYCAVGLVLVLVASFIQFGAQEAAAVSQLRDPVPVTQKTRMTSATLCAVFFGPIAWVGFLIGGFREGQAMFMGLLGVLLGGGLGWILGPIVAASEKANPSGFRKS